jgi:hypothetical protein
MAQNKQEREQRLSKRNSQIKKDYLAMRDEKYEGVRKYTDDYIIKRIAEKYFLAEITIYQLIFNKHEK